MTMTCREVRDFLVDYLAGDIAPADRGELEGHLAACPHCADHVDAARQSLRLTRTALAQLSDPSSRDVPESLLRAIQAVEQAAAESQNESPFSNRFSVQFSEVPIRV